ncbi:MAG: heavy-metal-associated domain-containing protein [Bacteroidales bacterium]
MRTKVLSMVIFMGMSAFTLFAADGKTEQFKVAGNCGMCETRIEKAANAVNGVTAADWNRETKMIEVSFNAAETNIDKIQEAIAKVGHDTEKFRTDDETYDNLPGCCKYERMTYATKDSQGSAQEEHVPHMH